MKLREAVTRNGTTYPAGTELALAHPQSEEVRRGWNTVRVVSGKHAGDIFPISRSSVEGMPSPKERKYERIDEDRI